MADPVRVLVLGGTADALDLARRLDGAGHLAVTYSLAGRTAQPRTAATLRRGGFGGAAGLRRYLLDSGTEAVVDATHPFAARISANAFAACRDAGRALLQLVRPAWTPVPGDRWLPVADPAAAAAALPALGRRVFLTAGGDPAAFAAVPDTWFLVRRIEPPGAPLPLPRHRLVLDRGPFDADAEAALMRAHRIEVLVTKNAGGTLTAAKLAAARRLGLPVVMVERPPLPDGARVPDAAGAAVWVLARWPPAGDAGSVAAGAARPPV